MATPFGLKLGQTKGTKPNAFSRPPGKPNPLSSSSSAPKKPSIFGDLGDDDSDDDDPTKSLNKKNVPKTYGLQKPASSIPSKRSGPGSLDKPKPPPEELEEVEDPSIYDYDTAWDNMKAAETRRKEATETDDRKPKYMTKLLAAAEVRERDRLRAKERMLQKEREAEGDEFADKEKFVTGAYKKQQEDMRQQEEEEQRRQEEMQKKGNGITSFYRNMLDNTEKQHEELVKATEKKKDEPSFLISRPGEDDKPKKAKTDAEIAADMNRRTAGSVAVNDEGQIVDKRQLLGAGLNFKPKAASKPQDDPRNRQSRESYNSNPRGDNRANQAKRDMRERQSRLIEQQMEDAARKKASEDAAGQAELERQAKLRKTTAGDVNSARERYLQRKKEAEEKKRAGG